MFLARPWSDQWGGEILVLFGFGLASSAGVVL
jgi:hypothetical protein